MCLPRVFVLNNFNSTQTRQYKSLHLTGHFKPTHYVIQIPGPFASRRWTMFNLRDATKTRHTETVNLLQKSPVSRLSPRRVTSH
jgi:hypothetical protein